MQLLKDDSKEGAFDIQKEKPDTSLVLDYLECDNIKDIFPKVKVK